MSFKYIILNLLVLFIVLMVAIENYDTWTQPFEFLPEHQEAVKKSAAKAENPPAVGTNKDPASLRSFIVISEKNIFSPDRKDFPVVAPVEQSKASVRPQVVLYGVTMAGDYQAASVTSPGRSLRKGERETLTLKIGEKIGEYKLAKVSPDRIMLENNGDSFEVLLYDPRIPKKRIEVKAEVKPAAISTSQPTPAPPQAEAPKAIPSQETVEGPKEPVQQPVVRLPPAPVPARPYYPPTSFRRGRGASYPPLTPPAAGGTPAGAAIPAPAQESTGNKN